MFIFVHLLPVDMACILQEAGTARPLLAPGFTTYFW
jgi:hypothetical protein